MEDKPQQKPTDNINPELEEKLAELDKLTGDISSSGESSGVLDNEAMKLIMDIGLGLFFPAASVPSKR